MAQKDSHPIRVQIRDALSDPDAVVPASAFASAIGESLGRVAYYFKTLERTGEVESAGMMRVGATFERFYRSTQAPSTTE